MRHGTVRLRLAGIAAAAMASAVLASPASALPTFAAQTAVLVHAGPGDVAVGDFDGDGHQDMAVANGDQATVSIRLGTGTGSFTGSTSAATDFSTGNGGPLAVVTGDFNSDGKLDLATANSGTNDISVLMGNGDGTFVTPATHFSTGSNSNPNSLAIGDFNEDGKLDLAVSLSDPGHVAVLLGTTPGSFGAPTTFTVSQAPTGVRVADFNGDGHDDIAVAGGSSTGFVSVLLGTGSGSFAAPANLSVGANVRGIVVGDFNGDGSEDIAVTVASTATVAVFLATGGGSFGSPSSYAVAVNPSKITTADFDRDGHLDLAVSNQGSHNVSVLQGSAAGTFAGAAILNVLDGPLGLTTADFDGDGRQDIAVADSSASIASVLLNTTAVPTLTQLGSPNGSIGVSGFEPTDVAVAPDVTGSPSNVYLGSPQGIVVFDRDRATGVLTRAGCLNAAGTDGCTLLPGLGSSTDGQLAVSPDGKSVYMATGTALLTLTRNPSTGALTPAGCVNQDGSGGCSTSRQGSSFDPDWVRVSPENTSAYAGPPANTAGGVMSVFTRNTTTGALTQPAGATGCISGNGSDGNAGTCTQVNELGNQTDIAFSRSGRRAWISSHYSTTIVGFSRDPATGELTPLTGAARCVVDADDAAGTPTCSSARALKGVGRLVRADRNLYAVVGNGTDDGVSAFAIHAGGRLTQLPGASGCLTTSGHDGDTPQGNCTRARVTAGGGDMHDPREMVATPDGLDLYVEGDANGAVTTLARDATTGALSDVACVGDNTNGASCTKGSGMLDLDGIAISPDGRSVYGSTVPGIVALTRHVRHSVSGTASPAAGGAVAASSSSTNAICSGSSCTVEDGGSATLTPSAASGYRFTGWSGACAGQQGACTLQNVTSDQAATANFARQVTVAGSASPAAGGSVAASSPSGGANCTGGSCTVDSGSDVLLTESPAAGYRFTGWSGACSGPTVTCVLQNATSDQTATAVFIRRYTVTAAGSPAGSGTVVATSQSPNSVCSATMCVVDPGGNVSLTANPASGFKFKSWSGACSGTAQTCTLPNVNSDLSATALFESLAGTTSTSGPSTVTATKGGLVPTGVTVLCKQPCVLKGVGKVTSSAPKLGVRSARSVTIARVTKHVKAGRRTKVVLKLTAAGKKRLKQARKLRMKVSVVVTAPGAAPVKAGRTLTVKAPKRKGH